MSQSNQERVAAAYGLTVAELKSLAEAGMNTMHSARRTAAWLRRKLQAVALSPQMVEELG